MGTPNSPFITIVVMSGVLNILLGVYAYLKKSRFSGMPVFILISIASAAYAFGFAFELASSSLEEIKRWIGLEYVGMPFIPPLSLILALLYVGLEKYATRFRLALLFAIPILTWVLVITNDAHHFFYRSIYFRAGTPAPMVDVVAGNWYIVHGAYSFACMLTSVFLLLNQWRHTKKAYRRQLLILLAGILLPMAGSTFYLMGLTPYGMDVVPILMSITSSLYIWAILSTDMFTVVPIAKESLFDSMKDGVLVLDLSNNLVDYNQAAVKMIPPLTSATIGHSMDQIWTQIAAADGGNSPLEGKDEIRWENDGGTCYYQIRSSIVRKRSGQEAGKIIVLIDVTKQKLLQDKLRHLAYYDGLTQVYNRTHFLHQCSLLLQQALPSNQPVSLILFDLDNFKSINDTYGHNAGDQALHHVVSVCRALLRPEDVFGRYGGEEFVIGLPGVSLEEAGQTAENLRQKISSDPMATSQGLVYLTASFGAAEASSPFLTLETMLREADQALYCAKRDGRDTVYLVSGETVRKWGT